MASHPTPLKLLALGLHSYFVYYWGKQLLGSPAEARPERGVGLLGSTGPQDKYHAKGQRIIEAFRNERRQKLQKVRGSAQLGQIAGKFADLGPIGSRVGVLRELVRRYSGADAGAMRDPKHVAQVGALTEAVREVVAQRCKPANEEKGEGGWCTPEKDWKAEVKALYNWYRANVRYTRDPLFVDTFSAPDRTLGTKAGDCDDGAVVLGTLLTLIGCNIRFRVIQTKDAQTWSHIYLMVDVDGNGKQWLPLDVTMPHGFPWQAPGAAECARNGRPAGIVTRVRDFPL